MPKYYVEIEGSELGIELSHTETGTGTEARYLDDAETAHQVDFTPVFANTDTGDGLYSLIVDGKSYQVHVERTDEGLRMVMWRHRYSVAVLTEREWRLKKVAPRQQQAGGEVTVKAPMPGLVKSVQVAEGDTVQAGDRLVVLEAMKMENDITAPGAGTVNKVHVAAGSTVDGGKPLVTLS